MLRYDQMIPLEDVSPGWGTDLEWFQNSSKLGVVGREICGAGGPIWYALWQDEIESIITSAASKGTTQI